MNLDDTKARLIDPAKLDSEGMAGGATHKGIISPTQEKYIMTGWYSFNKNINIERMNQSLDY